MLASIGAGGVLYLSPLLFKDLGFSSTQIGIGITVAAISGTIARIVTGFFLDKGIQCSTPIKVAALFAIIADLFLINSFDFNKYLQGQLFLGTAAGVYWPSAEISVPIFSGNYPSSKGFALVRSADALGIFLGSSIGTISSWLGTIRSIYIVDIICMLLLFIIISQNFLKSTIRKNSNFNKDFINDSKNKNNKNLIKSISGLLLISLYSTSIFSLLQSGLPLDLILGSELRPSLNQSVSGLILSVQLGLILLFQWPIGRWLSTKNINFSLRFSLFFIGNGCSFLALSSRFSFGLIFILFSLLFFAIGLTAFLPTATEGIIKASSIHNRGIAMALFSQCFGISAVIAPYVSGRLFDITGNGIILWSTLAIFAYILLPSTYIKKIINY